MILYVLCVSTVQSILNLYRNTNYERRSIMKYECFCGYVYDENDGEPGGGIAAGTKWSDVPEDFTCPLCGAGKDAFTEV